MCFFFKKFWGSHDGNPSEDQKALSGGPQMAQLSRRVGVSPGPQVPYTPGAPIAWNQWHSLVPQSPNRRCTLSFSIMWEFEHFVNEQGIDVDKLSVVPLITGDNNHAYLERYGNYIYENWGEVGFFVFKAACHAMKFRYFASPKLCINRRANTMGRTERAEIRMKATSRNDMVAIIQTLSFLAANCRVGEDDAIYSSAVTAHFTPELEISVLPLIPLPPNGNRQGWISHYRGFIIASQFPAGQKGVKGLEIPYTIMMQHAQRWMSEDSQENSRRVQQGDQPQRIRGLYPVRHNKSKNVVIWRFAFLAANKTSRNADARMRQAHRTPRPATIVLE